MKTMKRWIATVCSVLIGASAIMAPATEASALVLGSTFGDIYYTEWTEMSEYFDFSDNITIYRKVGNDNLVEREESAYGILYGPFYPRLSFFTLTDAEAAILSDF